MTRDYIYTERREVTEIIQGRRPLFPLTFLYVLVQLVYQGVQPLSLLRRQLQGVTRMNPLTQRAATTGNLCY